MWDCTNELVLLLSCVVVLVFLCCTCVCFEICGHSKRHTIVLGLVYKEAIGVGTGTEASFVFG